MNFDSDHTLRPTDCTTIPTALMNRKGRMVNEKSQASKQAKKPNHKTPSKCGGTLRKFCRRSILTLDDS